MQALERAVKLVGDERRVDILAVALTNLASALARAGAAERTTEMFEQACVVHAELDHRPKRLELYPAMIDHLETLGQHAWALALMREFKTLSDEMTNVETLERVAALKARFDLRGARRNWLSRSGTVCCKGDGCAS